MGKKVDGSFDSSLKYFVACYRNVYFNCRTLCRRTFLNAAPAVFRSFRRAAILGP